MDFVSPCFQSLCEATLTTRWLLAAYVRAEHQVSHPTRTVKLFLSEWEGSFIIKRTFGSGVIQKLQNKYLIWFDWEHTVHLACASVTPPRPLNTFLCESEDIFFLPTHTTFPFYDHIKFRLKKKKTDIRAPPHVFSAKTRIHPH